MEAKLDPVGKGSKPLQVVLDAADIEAIDNWRRQQPGIPPRGAVIRHFFRKGLGSVSADSERGLSGESPGARGASGGGEEVGTMPPSAGVLQTGVGAPDHTNHRC